MNITIQGINKSFDHKKVLSDITLKIQDKKFTTLLGPSGCGKTTLLRIIAGLEKSDSGELYFDDTLIYSQKNKIDVPPEKRNLSFVFQDFSLWPHMTIFENVAYGLRATKQTKNLRTKVMDALDAVKLTEYETLYPHQLSGGQQQRVAFARAIAVSPKCILFDEPLSALDAILRDEMRVEIKKLVSERNITSIFVTHDQAEAMSMSDTIIVLEKGKIAQIGSPESIYHNPSSIAVAKFIGQSNWISPQSMVRPEAMSVHSDNLSDHNYFSYPMKVIDVHFLGNCYDILVRDQTHEWHLRSTEKYNLYDDVTIYFNSNSVFKF